MITSPIDQLQPKLRALARGNYERIRNQLGRLDDDARAATATAMMLAVINEAAVRYGAAETALWLTSLADELLEDDDNAPDDFGGESA